MVVQEGETGSTPKHGSPVDCLKLTPILIVQDGVDVAMRDLINDTKGAFQLLFQTAVDVSTQHTQTYHSVGQVHSWMIAILSLASAPTGLCGGISGLRRASFRK